MSSGVNKVILVGNLGQDPDVRYTAGGQAVCELSVATNESWKGKDGQRQEKVEWHRVVVWGKDAENAAKYLTKGRQLYVEGRIQTRSYEDKEGQKRWITEIIAQRIVYLAGGKEGGRQDDGTAPPLDDPHDDGRGNGGGGGRGPDDDIPF
jgi:single-strand DNA-binding protein